MFSKPYRLALETSSWGVKLTTHLHTMLRLRMTGAIALLPIYAFTIFYLFCINMLSEYEVLFSNNMHAIA